MFTASLVREMSPGAVSATVASVFVAVAFASAPAKHVVAICTEVARSGFDQAADNAFADFKIEVLRRHEALLTTGRIWHPNPNAHARYGRFSNER